jgi:MerR family transcriptional regulator, light-induced transcriptional regulator
MSSQLASAPGISEDLIKRYVAAQVTHDRHGALAVVDEAVAMGSTLPEIYVHLIQRAQYELGRLWQDNSITIGQEHSGTAISQLALTHLYSRLPRTEKIGKTVLIACVEGELHDLGARMVSDAFEMHGYDVIYLGANVPTDTLVTTILDVMPDIVGLSVTMSFNVTAMYEVVRRVRESAGDGIEFLGGGHGLTWLKDAPGHVTISAPEGDVFSNVSRLSKQITEVPDELQLSALTNSLTARKEALTLQVVDDMYQNPFWTNRFGDRGRKFAEADGQRHVDYLVQAIEVESPEILLNYTRWLRNVLTQRGMCSRHIGENLERLANAIEGNNLPDAPVAVSYLHQAVQALTYTDDSCREIQSNEDLLVQQTMHQISKASVEHVPGVSSRDDVRYFISYLVDALHMDTHQVFVDYIIWQGKYLEEQGLSRNIALDVLNIIDTSLKQIPASASSEARGILEAGRQAIGKAQPCSS